MSFGTQLLWTAVFISILIGGRYQMIPLAASTTARVGTSVSKDLARHVNIAYNSCLTNTDNSLHGINRIIPFAQVCYSSKWPSFLICVVSIRLPPTHSLYTTSPGYWWCFATILSGEEKQLQVWISFRKYLLDKWIPGCWSCDVWDSIVASVTQRACRSNSTTKSPLCDSWSLSRT